MLQRKLNFGIRRRRISKKCTQDIGEGGGQDLGGRIWAWHGVGQHFAALKLPISCLTELLKCLDLVWHGQERHRTKGEGGRSKDSGLRT